MKIKRIAAEHIVRLLLFSIVWLNLPASAQNTTESPYSIFGLGDLETTAFAHSIAMGHARYSLALPYTINIANPASYGIHPLPTFDAGFSSNFLQHSFNGATKTSNSTYFKNFAFAFPVSKRWWASSFGLVPYSKMGYKISTVDSVQNFGSVTSTYEGKGGISRFFIGNAFNILKDSVQQFSAGVNVSYLFGSLTRSTSLVPEDNTGAYSTKLENNTNVGDFFFDAGLIYSRKVNAAFSFSAGIDHELGKNVKASNSTLALLYTGTGLNEKTKDTITADSVNGFIYLPSRTGFGLSVLLKEQWLFAIDYSLQDWTQFSAFDQKQALAKKQEISFGAQYNYNAKERESFFKMMSYRAGFRIANTPLLVQQKQVDEYGITFGVGIPIGEKTRGSFNFAVETGIRGENGNGLAREQFTNFQLGFSFTPSYYDRWFVKPKID